MCAEEQHLCPVQGFHAGGVNSRPSGCDVKVHGDGDIMELSAADASNPDEAKVSVNSVSLILVYICPPVQAHPSPPPPTMTRPCDEGSA